MQGKNLIEINSIIINTHLIATAFIKGININK